MKKLRIALIGCGFLGTRHAKCLASMRQQVDLVSVCDHTPANAKILAKQYNVSHTTDYHSLIGHVDAVTICTPTISHAPIAEFFLNNHVHTFIEKPISTTIEEANQLIALADLNGLILQVGHVERFNSAYRTIEPLINQPLFIECHRLNMFPKRSLDIGAVLDLMIHDIDIILGLVKSPVKDVHAVGVNVLTDKEDIANARITFANGCVANITCSRVSPEITRKIRLFTKDAYISLNYANQEAKIYTKDAKGIHQHQIPIEKEEPLKQELEHFVQCVKTNQQPIVSGREGREALKLAITITTKIWEHQQNILSS